MSGMRDTTSSVTNVERAIHAYSADNQTAARVILSEPAKYPVGSLMVQWARAVLAKGAR